MKKLLLCLLAIGLALMPLNSEAAMSRATSKGEKMEPRFVSLLFYANYADGDLTADFALGSPTATFTASRDATHPATYFDANGVMQVTTTSNVGRFNSGFYDTSGFNLFTQAGVMIEGASTTFLTDSMFGRAIGADDWASNWGTMTVSATSLINIAGAKERNSAYTFGGAEGDFEKTIHSKFGFRTREVALYVIHQHTDVDVSEMKDFAPKKYLIEKCLEEK